MPEKLSCEAKREWGRVVDELEAAGVVQKVDRALLSLYAQAWGEWCELRDLVAKEGYLVRTRAREDGSGGNLIQNPHVGLRNKAADRVVMLAMQFGFSPAARARLKAPEGGGEKESEKLRFFGGGEANEERG